MLDLAVDVADCLGDDSDSLACYMVPLDAFFLVLPVVPGIADNVLRHADDVGDVAEDLGQAAVRGVDGVSDAGAVLRQADAIELQAYGGPGGGHHIHAKAAFVGHPDYDEYLALGLRNEVMEAQVPRWKHSKMTGRQQELFRELGERVEAGIARNTMIEHNRIAVEALVAGGVPRPQARQLVAQSLWNLRGQGVRYPTRIPWRRDLGVVIGTFR